MGYSLHLTGAAGSAFPGSVEDWVTAPLDLGATPCLQMDSVYS